MRRLMEVAPAQRQLHIFNDLLTVGVFLFQVVTVLSPV